MWRVIAALVLLGDITDTLWSESQTPQTVRFRGRKQAGPGHSQLRCRSTWGADSQWAEGHGQS